MIFLQPQKNLNLLTLDSIFDSFKLEDSIKDSVRRIGLVAADFQIKLTEIFLIVAERMEKTRT